MPSADVQLQMGMCPECALEYVLAGMPTSDRQIAAAQAASSQGAGRSEARAIAAAEAPRRAARGRRLQPAALAEDELEGAFEGSAGSSGREDEEDEEDEGAVEGDAVEDGSWSPRNARGSGQLGRRRGRYGKRRPTSEDVLEAEALGLHRSTIWRRKQKLLQLERQALQAASRHSLVQRRRGEHRGSSGEAADDTGSESAGCGAESGRDGADAGGGGESGRDGANAGGGGESGRDGADTAESEAGSSSDAKVLTKEATFVAAAAAATVQGRGRGRARGRGRGRGRSQTVSRGLPGRPRMLLRPELELEGEEDVTQQVRVSGSVGGLLHFLHCAVCLQVLERTVVAPCMHRFCQECVEKWLRVGRHDCPECKLHTHTRRAFKRDVRIDSLIQNLIEEGTIDDAQAAHDPEAVLVRMPALESVQLALAKKKKSARRVAYYARRGRDANVAFAAGMPTPDEVATGGAAEAATSEAGSSSRQLPCARATTPPCVFVAEDEGEEGMEDEEGESEDEDGEDGEEDGEEGEGEGKGGDEDTAMDEAKVKRSFVPLTGGAPVAAPVAKRPQPEAAAQVKGEGEKEVVKGMVEKEMEEEEEEEEEEAAGEALYEAEATRLSQHSGPPTEEREGDAENALLDDEEEGVSYEEEGVSDEEEDVSDEDEDEDADGEEEDAREDAELAEGLVEEMVEELVEDEQQPQLDAGPAVEENGMQSGDDTVLLMHMEQDAQ